MIRYGIVTKGLLAAGFALFALFLFDAGALPTATAILLVAAVFGYAAWRELREPRVPPGDAEAPAKPPSPRTALAACATLLAIDIVFFGAPMLGTYAAIALILWLAPRIFLAWRSPDLRRHRATVALLTLGTIAVDCSVYWIYENVAQKRVIDVAEALIRHKARTGAYPGQLQQLVPEYLAAVPAAKPGLIMLNRIWYLRETNGPTGLMYVSFPPYGRRIYDVDKREWTDIDQAMP